MMDPRSTQFIGTIEPTLSIESNIKLNEKAMILNKLLFKYIDIIISE